MVFPLTETALWLVNLAADADVSGQYIRSIVNPLKILDDAPDTLWKSAAEPNLKAHNIGVCGASFDGNPSNDSRVKALVTQMAPINNRTSFAKISDGLVAAR